MVVSSSICTQQDMGRQQARQPRHGQSSHRQHVSVADKQVQAGGSLDRAPKHRRNSQTGMLQTSPSMRSMRPILGETTLNMLEVRATCCISQAVK